MDLQQPLLKNNSSCRLAMNSVGVLLPPINNNLSITTKTGTAENIAADTSSPSTSSTTTIVNHHHRNSQSLVTQKSNQVSTVLLYNIAIVSLYIEGQERLCLAQISNTLLKQFSYNEIHNRRVALGITCVQCTPVQLEILRRAGAMPVSSRRCGMITRREAERLCKSFLGDNTPPRLPEDFAFNVHHKCSWGCRGSFLPSRYNSSRAKCIKCHYCGMFFSPNKFIFHSHRIGPGDKYVQPDAANFNSWRRHMMLSGQPSQDVMYAWEDVKAMFNGGTRKRLMNSNSPSPLPRVTSSSPISCSAGTSSSSTYRDKGTDIGSNGSEDAPIINDIQKSSNTVSTVTAAATVVGVTAVAVGSAVRPLNLHFQASSSSGLSTESSYSVGGDMHLIPAAALSRSFMMDYMWQHAHHAAKNTYNPSSNSGFTFPWINNDTTDGSSEIHDNSHHSNINYSSSGNNRWTNSTRNLTQIINTSAFKPVVQHHQQQSHNEANSFLPTSRLRRSTPEPSTKAKDLNTLNNTPITTTFHHPTHASFPAQNKSFNNLFSSEEEDNDDECDAEDVCRQLNSSSSIKSIELEADSENLGDDIMVDIETTEDEKPLSFSNNTIVSSFNGDNSESLNGVERKESDNDKQAASDEDLIDVVHNDNDDTVLEFASLTPLSRIIYTNENERVTSSETPSTLTSLVNSSPKEFDKFNSIGYSNAENVPPPPASPVSSPKSKTSSPCSRSSEYIYIKNKTYCEIENSPKSVSITNSNQSTDDGKVQLEAASIENYTKSSRKRQNEKLIQSESETKTIWRHTNEVNSISAIGDNTDDNECGDIEIAVDECKQFKKKPIEKKSKEVQLIEALTQKYELTYNNNITSFKNNYTNNKNTNITSNNNVNVNSSNNSSSNDFWHMARLCMQRPINYEQNQKTQHNHQQLTRLPTFYYHHQQFLLSPTEHHQQQQNIHQTPSFPVAQRVVYIDQHQKLKKSQNHYSNEIVSQSPTSISSSHHTPMSTVHFAPESSHISIRQDNQDPANELTRANGIG